MSFHNLQPPVYGHTVLALVGQYSIPECNIEKDDTVFDIGAHFGFFSYYAVQKGAKEVYAFEPNPYVFEILKKHANIWSDKIKPLEFALYSSSGFLDLFIPTPLSISSTLREKENYEKVKVKTMTLDSFCKEYNVERVDFIKIDAEGSEREILKGAKETIRRFKPRMAVAAYHLPDDKEVIPELVLSIRNDYKFKLVDKGESVLFSFRFLPKQNIFIRQNIVYSHMDYESFDILCISSFYAFQAKLSGISAKLKRGLT